MKTLFIICGIGFSLFAQAETPKDSTELGDALGRFPQTEVDGDGVLKNEEAGALRQTKKADTQENKDGEAGGSSHIYKTVGKTKLHLFIDKPKGHKAGAKVPAIVFFHGGGFKSGTVKQFERQAEYFAERGMVAIRVRYRLTKERGVEIKDCVEDAISAMRWVRVNAEKLGVDPDRIAASGGSAGGYLSIATLMIDFINAKTDPAEISAKPNAMVLFNPGIGGKEKNGRPDPRDPDGKGDLKQYVKSGQPPTIIFHGKEDKVVTFAEVEAFTAAMKKAGNRCELVGYEGEGHSFFNREKYFELTIAEADKFLVGLGWLEKKAETK